MTPPVVPVTVDPLTTEGDAATQQAQATKTAARAIAQAIVKGVKEGVPAAPAAPAAPGAAPAPAAPTVAGAEGVVEQPTEPVATPQEIEEILAEAGLDIGLKPEEVPVELKPFYDKLVESAIDMAQSTLAEQMEVSEIKKEKEEFQRRLKDSPDKLLLALAVTRPEVFAQVVEVFQQMQADPKMKELVSRELQSEARLQEAERREAALAEHDLRVKARQVIAATKKAARIHGVPFDTAEKVVALAVQAQKGELDASDVDDIVQELRGLPKPPVAPRLATPARQAAVAAAPTQPVGGGVPAITGEPPASPGLTKIAGSKFRQLIRDAAARVRQAAQ